MIRTMTRTMTKSRPQTFSATFAAAVASVLAILATPAAAFAEYEKIEGRVRESIPAAPFLATAYAFIWAAVLVYVVLVARRLTRVQADMEDLRRRLDRGAS